MTLRPHVVAVVVCLVRPLYLMPDCAASHRSFASCLTEEGRLLTAGPAARMTAAKIAEYRADEGALLYYSAVEAGENLSFPLTDLTGQQFALKDVHNWGRVTQVGEGYVGAQYQKFIAAFRSIGTREWVTANVWGGWYKFTNFWNSGRGGTGWFSAMSYADGCGRRLSGQMM